MTAEREGEIAAGYRSVPPYPIRFSVAYPGRMSRWKGVQRAFGAFLTWAIPAGLGYVSAVFYFGLWIILASLIAFGVIVVPLVLSQRLRVKGLQRFQAENGAALERIARRAMAMASFALFLTDAPPDEAIDRSVRLDVSRGGDIRWPRAAVRSVLLVPHIIPLAFFAFAFLLVVPVCAIVVVGFGRYPRPFFGFTVGYLRWIARALGYWLLLTDRYPPFTFDEA
jgi:small-conductance mechanosensitive channel